PTQNPSCSAGRSRNGWAGLTECSPCRRRSGICMPGSSAIPPHLPPMPSKKSSRAEPKQKRLDWDPLGLLAGVDEAGRGPLAGPVVAAAVILDDSRRILGLADSKVLTPLARDRLYDKIREKSLCCSVGSASVLEID